MRLLARWSLLLGLLAVAGYWYSVHPPGFAFRGYIEDTCADMSRQVMADSLAKHGKPVFETERFMAPYGMSVPYFSWSLERDWGGAYFWNWNRDFPFLWAYFGVSLLISYFGVGWILRQMKLGPVGAWGLAALVTVFHVPRHFKLWYHFEYIAQHWVYLGFFLDAWVWHRWTRENRWSWTLEAWRGLVLMAVLGTPGYFWGPMILSWVVVRLGLLVSLFGRWRKGGPRIRIEGKIPQVVVPLILGVSLAWIQFHWFLPLLEKVRLYGNISQGISWYAHVKFFLRPLWMEWIPDAVRRFGSMTQPETVVTIGWIYWIPLIFGVVAVRKRAGGPGARVIAPFLVLLAIAVIYASANLGKHPVHRFLQMTIPFMNYFRVASRWGVFLPALTTVLIALSWPELTRRVRAFWPRWALIFVLFAVSSAFELGTLARPVVALPELDPSARQLLDGVRSAPGDLVLDFPFCVAGGNGVCTAAQCPNYPKSTAGQCFAAWHDKRVMGLYQARMAFSQCEIYNRAPFVSWFSAWREQRCFNESEWKELCTYLNTQPGISAILVYPEIWRGAASEQCQAEFRQYLGQPLETAQFSSTPNAGALPQDPIRILRFEPRCR